MWHIEVTYGKWWGWMGYRWRQMKKSACFFTLILELKSGLDYINTLRSAAQLFYTWVTTDQRQKSTIPNVHKCGKISYLTHTNNVHSNHPLLAKTKRVRKKNSMCVYISQGVCLDPDDWQVALVANLSLLEKRLVKEALTSSEALAHVCVFKGESVCVYVNNTREGAQLCVYSPGVRLSSLAHKPFRTD